MLGFPAHGGSDARAAAGMIVEDELLHRTGIQLAVFSQQHVHIRFGVRLLGRVQAITCQLRIPWCARLVLVTGVRRKKYSANRIAARGSTATSVTPAPPNFSPHRASLELSAQFRKAKTDDDQNSRITSPLYAWLST